VDNRDEIRDFLTSRRAKISPDRAGLPAYGGNRRVPGLRREEVALLAGVSIDYYTRLERGNLNGVSEGVLDALAGALQLDEAERAHLFDLARESNSTPRTSRRRPVQQVRASVQQTLDAMAGVPAYVRNGRRDILAANRLGHALYSEMYLDPARPVNVARFVFLSSRARTFFLNWEGAANDTVAILRIEAAPHDRELSDLVGELSMRSEHSVGRAQRPLPPHRVQGHSPPDRRGPSSDLRGDGPPRRPRPVLGGLQRRTRLTIRGRAEPARQLGSDARPDRCGRGRANA
jgi:transcriptional regulator with XRE-family HTH domain